MELRTLDGTYGLVLPSPLQRQLEERSSASWPNETGGILVGHYNERRDTALVTLLPPAPADSISKRSRFIRGARGLRDLLAGLWNRAPADREYYLGEWHSHPGQVPVPSSHDDERMRSIAGNPEYRCREPVLVIVGGDPSVWSIAARVYPKGSPPLLMNERRDCDVLS